MHFIFGIIPLFKEQVEKYTRCLLLKFIKYSQVN